MTRRWLRPLRLTLLVVLVNTSLEGCGTDMTQQGFDSPDPAAKLHAIVEAGRVRDRSALPDLVEQLDSDDPAVRMYSIVALERITGTRLGYSPYAPPQERQAAVDEWVHAVEDGRFAQAVTRGQP